MKMKSSKKLSNGSMRSTAYSSMSSGSGKHGKAVVSGKEKRKTSYSK